MKKEMRVIVIAGILLCLLFGVIALCDKPMYRIEIEDGQYYLCFTQEEYPEPINPQSIPFRNALEMKKTILSGGLDDDRISYLWNMYYDGERLPICNLDKVYQVQFPEGTTLENYYVKWAIEYYMYYFKGIESDRIQYTEFRACISEEGYNAQYELHHKTGNKTITSQETVADRNATVTKYYNRSGSYQWIDYELTDGDKRLKVQEFYCLDYYSDSGLVPESTTAPISVYLYGEQDGKYFFADMDYNIAYERPSEEWLLSFGLEECQDTSWVAPTIICAIIVVGAGALVVYKVRKKRKATRPTPPQDMPE